MTPERNRDRDTQRDPDDPPGPLYERILVPTDGSAASEAAVEAGVELADAFGADLFVVHVLVEPSNRASSDAVTESAAAKATAAGVEVTTAEINQTDTIHGTILAYAADHEIDCIVAGTHGRTGIGRLVMGSIAELLLRESTLPVLTVHKATVVTGSFDRILVPTDGSECAEAAAQEAIKLAQWSGAGLHVINVLDVGVAGANIGALLNTLRGVGEEAIQRVVDQAQEAGISPIESTIIRGIPYWSIVGYIDDHDIDCVVMGTHGRTGFERYFLGSVTERVARLADIPVLTIRGPEAPSPAERLAES